MRNLLIAVLLLAGCNKQQQGEKDGINFYSESRSFFYAKCSIKAQEFCDKKLYTIAASNDPSEELMISLVADTLVTGSYPAGLNYWGKWLLTNNIKLNVVSFHAGTLSATFTGSTSSGTMKNIHFN